MEAFLGIASIVWIIFSLVMLVVWIMLPFAVFGIKRRIDRIIDIQIARGKQ